VAISANWLDVTREPDVETLRPALEVQARTLLARFYSPTEVPLTLREDAASGTRFFMPNPTYR
jgi:hypothetical protein